MIYEKKFKDLFLRLGVDESKLNQQKFLIEISLQSILRLSRQAS